VHSAKNQKVRHSPQHAPRASGTFRSKMGHSSASRDLSSGFASRKGNIMARPRKGYTWLELVVCIVAIGMR
jgi:hypothetical protein